MSLWSWISSWHKAPGAPASGGNSSLAWGSTGWDGDGGNYVELGTTSDDGNILMRVTLFRGRDPGKALDQKNAQGQQILCKLASNFVQIPPRGTRVLVAIPETFGMIPGGSMIIAADNPNPVMIGNLKPGEAGVVAAIGAARVLVKKNGAIVLYTVDGSGKSVVLYVGPDKIQMGNAFGAITLDAGGFTATSGPCALTMTPQGVTTLSGTQCSVSGSIAAVAGQVATCIGKGAVPTGVPGVTPGLNSALLGTAVGTGGPVAGLVTPSTNVFMGS